MFGLWLATSGLTPHGYQACKAPLFVGDLELARRGVEGARGTGLQVAWVKCLQLLLLLHLGIERSARVRLLLLLHLGSKRLLLLTVLLLLLIVKLLLLLRVRVLLGSHPAW